MTKEIGPREKQLRELREQKFARKPSVAELRNKVAKVNPKPRKQGRRSR